MKRLIPWAQFFRLPNLPTAPGDAVAGAAICMAVSLENAKPGATGIAIGAGLAALFLYMFGLADNDISGYKSDITYAPHRPLVAGSITLSHALLARLACLLFVAAIGFICGMPIEWWSVVFLIFISITLYNRLKDKYRIAGLFLMGLCRGLSVLSGAVAMTYHVSTYVWTGWRSSGSTVLELPCWNSIPVWLAVAGWTLYITGVTVVASDEHEANAPLGWWRFIPGLAVFLPMLALSEFSSVEKRIIITFCTFCAYAVWWLSVLPLGQRHEPSKRRKAVGNAIGGLAYLQAAYILSSGEGALIGFVLLVFVFISTVKRTAPKISGS